MSVTLSLTQNGYTIKSATGGHSLVDALTVGATGNILIGTLTESPSNEKLYVNGFARISSSFVESQRIAINYYGTGNRFAYLDFVGDSTYSDFGLRIVRQNAGLNSDSMISHRGTGALSLQTSEVAPIFFATNNIDRGRFTAIGNLLIGTSNDDGTNKLQVNGVARIGTTLVGSDSIEINSYGSGDRNAFIDFHGDDTYTDYGLRIYRLPGANNESSFRHRGTGPIELYAQDAGYIRLLTSSTEKMRITNSGNLLLGTTTDNGGDKLQVAGSISSTSSITIASGDLNVQAGNVRFDRSGTIGGGIFWTGLSDQYGIFTELYSGTQQTRLVISVSDDADTDYIAFRSNAVEVMAVRQTSVTITTPLVMNSNRIAAVGTPLSGTDAATKDYVDNNGGGVQTVQVTSGAFTTTTYPIQKNLTVYDAITATDNPAVGSNYWIGLTIAGGPGVTGSIAMVRAAQIVFNWNHDNGMVPSRPYVRVGDDNATTSVFSPWRGIAWDDEKLNLSGGTMTGNLTMTAGTYVISNGGGGQTSNTAFGRDSLLDNTTGLANTAYGVGALQKNTQGWYNTAVGYSAAFNVNYLSAASIYNTAVGANALFNTTTGYANTAIGGASLGVNITGNYNTALGYGANASAGFTALTYATAIGAGATVSTSDTVVLGRATDKVVIGATGSMSGELSRLQVTGGVASAGNLVIGIGIAPSVGIIITAPSSASSKAFINVHPPSPVGGVADVSLGGTAYGGGIKHTITSVAANFNITSLYRRFFTTDTDVMSYRNDGNTVTFAGDINLGTQNIPVPNVVSEFTRTTHTQSSSLSLSHTTALALNLSDTGSTYRIVGPEGSPGVQDSWSALLSVPLSATSIRVRIVYRLTASALTNTDRLYILYGRRADSTSDGSYNILVYEHKYVQTALFLWASGSVEVTIPITVINRQFGLRTALNDASVYSGTMYLVGWNE